MILAHIASLSHVSAALGMFQEAAAPTVGFSPLQLWQNMSWIPRGIVIILFIMSIWSLAVMIDRCSVLLRCTQAVT